MMRSKTRIWAATVALAVGLASTALPARAEPKTEKKDGEGTYVRTLYLIRHGAYDWEDERDPAVGKSLTPLGVAQARLTAARLRALPVKIDEIYSSKLTRARETAFVIAEELPDLAVEQTELLVECHPPSVLDEVDARSDRAELEACKAQLDQAFERFFRPATEPGRHEVLAAHGNVIRYLTTRAIGADTELWINMLIGHCSVTVVEVGPAGSRLVALGDVGHLPPNLQSGATTEQRPLVVPANR